MTLQDLGFTPHLETYQKENGLDSFEVARVIAEHKERYVVKTATSEYEAEIMGNLRFTAQSRTDFPAVGDWVAISEYEEDKALIHAILPRTTLIERQAVGKHGEKQIIATNIDYAFIVQAVDRDFNINRIERYLTICHTSRVEPIIVLTKIDLISEQEVQQLTQAVRQREKGTPIVTISNETQEGINNLNKLIKTGKTYCLLGSSGVGKSTLTNNLLGKQQMKTAAIGEGTNRGRHVTSHRELLVLNNGGILIDNPGMREVGIADSGSGMASTFEAIFELAQNCRFKDCTHTTETGCAVLEALENDELEEASYENYLKMEKEKEHFESTVAEKRKKDKAFGKMFKNYKKGGYKDRYK